MSYFESADEVYHHIGRLFELAVNDDAFVKATAESGLVLRLTQSEPDAVIVVDFPARKVLCGEAAAEVAASVELKMTSDDSHRFCLGKLSLTRALAQGSVQLEGSRTKALKLMPLTKLLFARYRALLQEAGRKDLADA